MRSRDTKEKFNFWAYSKGNREGQHHNIRKDKLKSTREVYKNQRGIEGGNFHPQTLRSPDAGFLGILCIDIGRKGRIHDSFDVPFRVPWVENIQ